MANHLITLNDYLYDGNTIFRILKTYYDDLKAHALETHNPIDMAHCNFLLEISELLRHNDFLTAQSQKFREFYKYMTRQYPTLAFTFKGRIKSLIRAEEKFNGYIVDAIYDQYTKDGTFPDASVLKERVSHFRDLIAYRIVIAVPKCHLKPGEDRTEVELNYLYDIANKLSAFMEARGFNAELSGFDASKISDRLDPQVRPYYRDYVKTPRPLGYQSLHITFFDTSARCYIEVQLRTKDMDDAAEIGRAKHSHYEARQEQHRLRRKAIPEGENLYFDEAYERVRILQNLDLSKVDVNLFAAIDNHLINDGCGLFRGRLILPYEHLSQYQNDLID
jgi:hypothetical protein